MNIGKYIYLFLLVYFTSSRVFNCLSSNNFCKKSSSTRSPIVNHWVSSNESRICETAKNKNYFRILIIIKEIILFYFFRIYVYIFKITCLVFHNY